MAWLVNAEYFVGEEKMRIKNRKIKHKLDLVVT